MTRFGDFEPLCRNTPSYPWCNLFYREVLSLFIYPSSIHSIYPYKQLQHHAPGFLIGASANTTSAPVGVNPKCGIPRVGFDGSIGNIANILACSFSILVLIFLIVRCNSRKAAVGKSTLSLSPSLYASSDSTPGRIELRAFLTLYLFTLPLQLITTGSFLEQGTTTLVVFTAIHAGAVAALFWTLLGNALVATQIVEDGTPSSLIVCLFSCRCPSALANGHASALLYFHGNLHGRHHLHLS